MSDTSQKYMLSMGKLVVNFQSLEFALRAFLYNHESGWRQQGDPTFLENIKEGNSVKENAFTNWDQLGKLIKKYNEIVGSTNPEFFVDADLKNTRDALAHGRIASRSPSSDEPQKLVKYDKPSNEKVHVTHCVVLSKDWFDKEIRRVYEAVQKVSKANDTFWHKMNSM
jgi:hypothetical protein